MKTRKAPFGAFGYPAGATLKNPVPDANNPELIWWTWPNGQCLWIGPDDETETTPPAKTLSTYKVTLGSGTRTVEAPDERQAIEKATGRLISRFTKTGVGEYRETACAPGHQCTYTVAATSKL